VCNRAAQPLPWELGPCVQARGLRRRRRAPRHRRRRSPRRRLRSRRLMRSDGDRPERLVSRAAGTHERSTGNMSAAASPKHVRCHRCASCRCRLQRSRGCKIARTRVEASADSRRARPSRTRIAARHQVKMASTSSRRGLSVARNRSRARMGPAVSRRGFVDPEWRPRKTANAAARLLLGNGNRRRSRHGNGEAPLAPAIKVPRHQVRSCLIPRLLRLREISASPTSALLLRSCC
jgi:hypothetical protein